MEENEGVKGKKEKEWTMIEDEKCSACAKEGVLCWVDLPVIQKWVQDWMEEKKGMVKLVTQNLSRTNCERCTQKKVVCILAAMQRMRVEKVSGLKAPSMTSSSWKRRAKQLEVEIPVGSG